ncbi:hypothetical protein Btru_056998 [Bulinus truncatus]|nr:hypothetical protein Btru_056998 [Bulinus truncatus]
MSSQGHPRLSTVTPGTIVMDSRAATIPPAYGPTTQAVAATAQSATSRGIQNNLDGEMTGAGEGMDVDSGGDSGCPSECADLSQSSGQDSFLTSSG